VNVADPIVCNYERQSLLVAWTVASETVPAMVNSRSWLPKPVVMMKVLPPERREVYIQRYCERARQGGWFFKYKASPVDEWLLGQIRRTHEVKKVGECRKYCLYRCEYKGISVAPRP
jgi:hypothetical protein